MKDCSTCRFSIAANPHLHSYPSSDPDFFAALPCATCTPAEPQYERARVTYGSQWESPNRKTWLMKARPIEEETTNMSAVLKAYLLLSKAERRSLRFSSIGLYARVAVSFSVDDEDFLAERMRSPEGTSNAAIGRRLGNRGISRQLAYRRCKRVAEKLEAWRLATDDVGFDDMIRLCRSNRPGRVRLKYSAAVEGME